MNRRDFIKMLLASPIALYIGKAEANGMQLFTNDTPEISYFGRWLNGYTGFGATYIKTRFTGTKISTILKSPGIWWRAYIDNVGGQKFTSNGEVLLAQNLDDNEHEIKLVRLTEGQAGIAHFGGFILENNAKLLPYKRKLRALEFIGDSITAGAMNDGRLTGSNYNEVGDNDSSYGPILARMLDVEYSVVAKSGQGVAINYSELPPYTMPHAADLYNWTFFYDKSSDSNVEWDAAKFPVDATFIAYGTNDFTTPFEKPTETQFKEHYIKIIKTIRKKNGNIPIICLMIPSRKNVPYAAEYISEIVKETNNSGDKNIYYIEINKDKPLLKPNDFVDGKVHPTKAGSKKVAEFLLPEVKKILKF